MAPNKSGEWRIGEQRLAINSQGSRLDGAGCMNVNQFMGLRIKVGVEDRRIALGNQFAGLQTKSGEWRIGEQR